MKTLSSKVDNSLHSRFIELCNGKGCSPSERLRQLVEKDLGVDGLSKVHQYAGGSYILGKDETQTVDADGTIRRYKNGKLWAYKKQGGVWTYIIEA